jgi:hypothetical protein
MAAVAGIFQVIFKLDCVNVFFVAFLLFFNILIILYDVTV